MRFEMLKAKIHRACVTGAVVDYEGSISICTELAGAAGLIPFERVDVYNVNNGARFSTYVIAGTKGEVCLNGAAARLVQAGDLVIIASYCSVDEEEAKHHVPKVVLVGEGNVAIPVTAHPEGGATHD